MDNIYFSVPGWCDIAVAGGLGSSAWFGPSPATAGRDPERAVGRHGCGSAVRRKADVILWDTGIGDAGLEHLKPLKRLQEVIKWGTQVTRQGGRGAASRPARV